jgi:hypothetical protein
MKNAMRLLVTLGAGLALAAVALLFFSRLPALGEGDAGTQEVTLENGGFEGTYEAWEGSDARKIAPSWNLWYTTDWPDEDFIAPPKANEETRSDRVRTGKSQELSSDNTLNFDACLYQQISGITTGHYIRFGIWGRVDTTMAIPDAQARVGIDPSGGTDPRDIQYELNEEKWDIYTSQSGEWQKMSVLMKATSPTATVYACAHPRWAIRLESYWDHAAFTVTPESLAYMPLVTQQHYQLAPGELGNPDLEENWGNLEGYQVPIPGFGNVQVAPFWLPYWNDDYDPDGPRNKQPEYGPTGLNVGRDFRRHSGQVAQQIGSSGGGVFQAGIYQVVNGVTPGDTYSFTMWSHGWTQYWPSINPIDERISDYQEPGGLRFKIGIDPYGGESFTSTHIVWSEVCDPYDVWHHFGVTATAMSNRISVWTQANPDNPALKSNESFWDDASLTVIEPTVNLSSDAASVDEGAGAIEVTATLDVPSSQAVTVNYATIDGTAVAPDDYTAISGTLVFTPGVTSQTLAISISEDALEEEDETFLLALSEASHAAIGSTDSITLTILDND